MDDVKAFIDAFFEGLSNTTINLFSKYSFSLLELFVDAAILGILGYIAYRLFNG